MILIVDDIADSRDIMSRHLRREGYDVRTASGPKEAWSLLRSSDKAPQLIILDVMMPEVDGRSMLRQLRQHERLRDVPVLVCTANSTFSCMSEMLGLGAQGYLIKGHFDRECLLRCVEHYGGSPEGSSAPALDNPAATGARFLMA